MPDPAFRNALRNQLAAERDRKELLAADSPIEKIVPPPPPPPVIPPAPQPAGTAAPPAGADDTTANATLPGADAAPPPAAPAIPPPPPAPPKDEALQLVGDPIDTPGLPLVPDAPPAPATFAGVPAEPAPTVSTMPLPLPPPDGTRVFFPTGAATLAPSQMQTLRDVVSHRKAQTILITGLGDALSDTPEGQEAAIDLGLHRARAVADAFAGLHVPQTSLRLAARAYGRGAVISLLP
jgi:outer membrane protein OmpA-like peptidoglycan-associated protein